jgi:hypothetical protein
MELDSFDYIKIEEVFLYIFETKQGKTLYKLMLKLTFIAIFISMTLLSFIMITYIYLIGKFEIILMALINLPAIPFIILMTIHYELIRKYNNNRNNRNKKG